MLDPEAISNMLKITKSYLLGEKKRALLPVMAGGLFQTLPSGAWACLIPLFQTGLSGLSRIGLTCKPFTCYVFDTTFSCGLTRYSVHI